MGQYIEQLAQTMRDTVKTWEWRLPISGLEPAEDAWRGADNKGEGAVQGVLVLADADRVRAYVAPAWVA